MPPKKILIIDDDNDFVASTKIVLEAKGYEVASAISKEEGLNKIKEFIPDLIIMDVMMEKMCDGFDLSRKLKNDDKYKNIPIFMVTAIGDITGFCYSTSGGDKTWLPIDDYADKPISSDELVKRIEKLLGK